MGIRNLESFDAALEALEAHNPSWGFGTILRAVSTVGKRVLITPHGDSEPPRSSRTDGDRSLLQTPK